MFTWLCRAAVCTIPESWAGPPSGSVVMTLERSPIEAAETDREG
jgi:hypothetical protein